MNDKRKNTMWLAGSIGVFVFTAVVIAYVLFFYKTPEEKAQAEAQEAVVRQIHDPATATFRNIHAVDQSTVCGEVNINVKDAYGGGSEYIPFSVVKGYDKKWNVSIADDDTSTRDVNTLCGWNTGFSLIYDDEHSTMRMEFKRRTDTFFCGVPRKLYESFDAAEAKRDFYLQHIWQNYSCDET